MSATRKLSVQEIEVQKLITFDKVLEGVGGFGRFQKGLLILLMSTSLFSCCQFFFGEFAYPHQSFSLFVDKHVNISSLYSCCSEIPSEIFEKLEKCYYIFDRKIFGYTFTEQLNLVCEREIYRNYLQPFLLLGAVLGPLFIGNLANKFGKRKCIFWSCILFTVSSLSTTLAFTRSLPSFFTFAGSLFFTYILSIACQLPAYTLLLEFISESDRGLVSQISWIPWSLGFFYLSGVAYIMRDWRYLQLFISSPMIIVSILIYYYVPESPRWLLLQGQLPQSIAVLLHIAHTNKTWTPKQEEWIVSALNDMRENYNSADRMEEEESAASITLLTLFKSKKLALRISILFLNGAANAMLYYGISYSGSTFGGNIYFFMVIMGSVEILSYALGTFILKHLGRRTTTAYIQILSGLLLIIFHYTKKDLFALRVLLIFFAKLGLNISFCVLYLLATELFSTALRAIVLANMVTFQNAVAIISPLILLIKVGGKSIAFILFGVVAIASATCLMKLPETKGRPLPETMEDSENF